jgi:hypothetical protein
MENNEFIDIPLISTERKSPTIETINRGKSCFYKNEKHFILYEAKDFKLISKKSNLTKAFCVNSKLVKYV